MEYGASTATLSKKLSNVYGFSGKSAYDGVFTAPTKFKATSFSSRVDDYCEIFGVSRGSSIPILEVPELNERKFSDDIRPTKLDYSKVFRGFENLDTAISYEELFAEPKREDSSLQEEWSPAKRGISNSGKNLSCIAESPVVSHEASYQSFDGAKIISVLSQGGKNGSNGMTHIAQIHAVSGYTCLFDEITPLKNDADKTLPSVVANTYPCNSVKERLKESRHCTTAVTSPPPDDASKQSSEDRVEVQNRSHRRRSDSVHLSDASDISHGSHYMNMFPSENPACYSDNLKEDSERSMETNGKVSNRNASELPGGDYSLPSFDDLVDSNSEVAASVAALRKAIEEAQERLKVAKESMKRKKEGFRDHVKLRFDYDSKSPREKEGKMAYKGNRKKETKTQEIFEEVDVSGQVPTGIGNEMMRPDQVTSDLGVKEIRFDAKEAVGETQKESEVEETEEEVEWEEVNQYIDDVNTSNYKVTRLEFEQARMLYNVDNNVCNGEKMYSKAFDKSEECDETLTVEPWGQENEKRVYAGKGACGGEEILEEIKSVQEVLAYEGKEERLTVLKNQEETEKKFEASPELEDCERRLNEFQEPKENEKEIAHDQGKIEKKFEVSSKQEECERYLRVHYEPVEDEKEVAPELNQIEGKVEVSCDLKECELRKYQEPIGNEKTFQPQDLDLKNIERQIDNQAWVEHDKIGQEACEENGKELNHVNEEEGIGKRFNNVYQQGIIDKKVDSVHEEEELEKRLTEDDRSDGNMKLQEAEEDVEVLEGASYWMLENAWGEEETCEWKETNRTQKARDENMEVFPETTKCEEENNKETDNISEPDKNVNLSENQEADLCMDSDRNLEVCSDVPAHEEQDTIVGVILTSFQPKKNKKGPEAVGNMKLQEAKEDAEVLEGASYWMLKNECGEEENARVETNRTHTARDENVQVTQEATKCEEEINNEADNIFEPDENGNLTENQEADLCMENDGNLEVCSEVPAHEEQDNIVGVTETSFQPKRNEKEPEAVGNMKLQEAKEDAEVLEGASYLMLENKCGEEENARVETNRTHTARDENVEVTQEATKCEEEINNEADNIFEPDENGNLTENQEADLCMENVGNLEVCSEVPAHEEQNNIVGVTKPSFQSKRNEKEPEAVVNMNNLGEKDILETVCLAQGAPRLDVAMDNTGDTIETLAFDKTGIDLGEDDLNVGKIRDQCVREAEIVCNLGMHVEELIPGYVEMNKDAKEAEVSMNDGMDQNYNEFSCEEILTSDRNNVEAVSQLTSMSERESKAFIYEDTKTNQATEKIKENHQTTLPVDKEKEYNSSQKLEVEKEYIRKIDEEKEQEREKEKLAVERAICEARERAFAEARERAAVDRTTAGACRRMMADTRDRLGKTSSLTSDKAPDEKASVEAKLKAERAAVERATTEARLRALEKAMSEKASFEARNKVDKLVAEKSSGAFRDNGLRQNFSYDAQDKGSWSSSCSIYRKSLDRGVDGANVESAQRCKARSERHQRIVERAEKALAEKNLRDLHAQKEQEERNRLAEVLYADVKRWSSGKEGNLRALLSTLHYVLGPDSGWQPIPLTDIVTTAAVKKAYRKATLCVHPDKLQQRGASIQQKYTCEKVFDLIKDAWNKFNKDER